MRRMQAFGGRRWNHVLELEKIRHGVGRRGQLEIRRVHDSWRKRRSASDANGLRAVVSFAASGAAGCARFRATQIFGARQFVRRIVNDFVRLQRRRGIGTQAGDLGRNVQQE